MDPPLSVTNISVLGSPESLVTVIKVQVRTSGSLYDITPTVESSHATEELPMDICPDMDTVEHNDKNSVILCDLATQLNNWGTHIRFSLKTTFVVTSTNISLTIAMRHCTVLGEQYIFL